VLELSRWNLRFLVFNYKLLELSGDLISSLDWFNDLLSM